MEEIRKWLNEQAPGFDQGFALFCKYSRNQSLMSYIGRKREIDQLKYELEKLSKMKVTPNPHYKAQHLQFSRVPVPVQEKVSEKVEIINERRVKREDLSPELQKLYDLNVDDYKLMRSYHEKMKFANSDAGRSDFRDKISKLDSNIKKRWAIIDSGVVPVDQSSASGTNLNTARAYISKMLKVENLTERQRETIKQYYSDLIAAGAAIKPETLKKLKERGF